MNNAKNFRYHTYQTAAEYKINKMRAIGFPFFFAIHIKTILKLCTMLTLPNVLSFILHLHSQSFLSFSCKRVIGFLFWFSVKHLKDQKLLDA